MILIFRLNLSGGVSGGRLFSMINYTATTLVAYTDGTVSYFYDTKRKIFQSLDILSIHSR